MWLFNRYTAPRCIRLPCTPSSALALCAASNPFLWITPLSAAKQWRWSAKGWRRLRPASSSRFDLISLALLFPKGILVFTGNQIGSNDIAQEVTLCNVAGERVLYLIEAQIISSSPELSSGPFFRPFASVSLSVNIAFLVVVLKKVMIKTY